MVSHASCRSGFSFCTEANRRRVSNRNQSLRYYSVRNLVRQQKGENITMAASVNVLTAALTVALSACLARTSDEISPPYQLAFINQSASFIINTNGTGYWSKFYSGGSLNAQFNCSCVRINPVNNDNNTNQLYFNSTTTSDAGIYLFHIDSSLTVVPRAWLSLLDVAIETNVSGSGLAVWDYVNVTCTLILYNGYIIRSGEIPAFSAPINITVNDRASYFPYEFNSTTSTGNVSQEFILPASNRYQCTASIFDNSVNALPKTKTVTTEQYQVWGGTPQFTPLGTTNVVSNSAIAVGLGVGLGVGLPLVILVIVVCVVCACRKKASKTRAETKPVENKDDVSEHTDDKGDSTLPGKRKSTHLTVVDNNVYSSAGYVDVKQSSPSAVALRPQPEGSNNAQVYDEIRMSMINSIMTKTNEHVSKATSPPPALPQDGNYLTASELAISLNGSQTDLTLVDSAIYSSNGTGLASSGMQLHGGETGTATIVCDTDYNTMG